MRALLAAPSILAPGPARVDPVSVTADIWVGDRSETPVDGAEVVRDSLPTATVRSLDAEIVTSPGEPPTTIAITAVDFEDDAIVVEQVRTCRTRTGTGTEGGGMIAQPGDAATPCPG